jgi:hypothetical protein
MIYDALDRLTQTTSVPFKSARFFAGAPAAISLLLQAQIANRAAQANAPFRKRPRIPLTSWPPRTH